MSCRLNVFSSMKKRSPTLTGATFSLGSCTCAASVLCLATAGVRRAAWKAVFSGPPHLVAVVSSFWDIIVNGKIWVAVEEAFSLEEFYSVVLDVVCLQKLDAASFILWMNWRILWLRSQVLFSYQNLKLCSKQSRPLKEAHSHYSWVTW